MKFLSLLCMVIATSHDISPVACIIGGEQVLPGDVRFIAQVESGGLLPSFQCGGVILNANTVLTGANCGSVSILLPDLLNSRVRVGSLKLGTGGQRIQVTQKTVVGDMAVLKLARDINMEDPQVAAIDLYSSPVQIGWQVNTAGWGSNGGYATVNDLQKVTGVSIRTDADCREYYGPYNSATMFCAGYHSGACGQYDYGGPVWLDNGQLAGIVIRDTCPNNNEPRFYFKVYPLLSQIQALL